MIFYIIPHMSIYFNDKNKKAAENCRFNFSPLNAFHSKNGAYGFEYYFNIKEKITFSNIF